MAGTPGAGGASLLRRSEALTLSFSGAGHLLAYHLGVAVALRADERLASKPILAASGSSSGALAAAACAFFPDYLLGEYAERFLSDGGRALRHFGDLLPDLDGDGGGPADRDGVGRGDAETATTTLQIAATRCSDGALHLFDVPSAPATALERERLMRRLEASCRIPRTFHPVDVLAGRPSSTYPDGEGTSVDGVRYVDGGIAAPAPPTRADSTEGACRVVVSPVSGPVRGDGAVRISPRDDTWKFPMDLKCRGGFIVHASVQNVKALQIAAGVATPSMLREWYKRGKDDLDGALHT